MQLTNDGRTLILTYNNFTLTFDKVLQTSKEYHAGITLFPLPESCHLSTPTKSMDINTLHNNAGHLNQQYLISTANLFNTKLTGHLHECVSCALAKAKQKTSQR